MFLVLLPLPWHWSARNVGTLLYIAWSFTGSLVFFVNSILWNGNMRNPAPVWCDIATKFMVGLNVAVPAVSLCINRRLYKIATMKTLALSPSEVRLGHADPAHFVAYPLCRNAGKSSSICLSDWAYHFSSWRFVSSSHSLIFQFLNGMVDYIVQGHRYDIVEDIGCSP